VEQLSFLFCEHGELMFSTRSSAVADRPYGIWCHLNMSLHHSRSLEVATFNRSNSSSYFVFFSNYGRILYCFRNKAIGRKRHFFVTLPFNLHVDTEPLEFLSNILTQTLRALKLLYGVEILPKSSTSTVGVGWSNVTDRRNCDDIKILTFA